MTPLELAICYMEIFFSGKDLDRLEAILHEEFQFRGPFYQFHSAQEYIACLKADPPVDCSYNINHTFEKNNVANLIYSFSKPGVSTTMSQLFEARDNKIVKMVLIFDREAFADNAKIADGD